MPKIALGVASSVSIYKACLVLRGFQKAGVEVQPVLTPNAARLISPLLFSSLSGSRTIVETFDGGRGPGLCSPHSRSDEGGLCPGVHFRRTCPWIQATSERRAEGSSLDADQDWSVAHVALAKAVDLLVVAPATANIIAKFAGGVADDFLSTFYLAVEKPILVAPAMNAAMWRHPQTRDNVARLRARGVEFIEPAAGYLACGDEGEGRLAAPEAIVEHGLEILRRGRSLAGKTILLTAGPTREFFDSVRFLSNRSSGKMGDALAREALRRGARVILVSGPTNLEPPAGAEVVGVVSAAEMARAVLGRLDECDIVVMAAAVADFSFEGQAPRKLKRSEIPPTLSLTRTIDILKAVAEKKRGQIVVGFAAETEDVRRRALAKLKDKALDLIVANDVSVEGVGFDSDFNKAILIDAEGGESESPVLSKIELSRIIWDAVERHAAKKNG